MTAGKPKPQALPHRRSNPGDIALGHWTQRALPHALRPYGRLARWDRPIGWWLLLLPCWWSLALASAPADWHGARLAELALAFVVLGIGAIAMRGAGCTWNDILDRHIDAQVERTRHRPLPSGEVSLRQAAIFMAVQAMVGAAVLFSFNRYAIVVGLASLAVVAIYPLMKRITNWPQAVLGLAFNWGALLGWAMWRGLLDWPALALYAGGIAWTLVYDTIYAMQDQRDDAVIGVRSTARRFQRAPQAWLLLFASLALAGFAAAGSLRGLAWPFWLGWAAVAAHFLWQIGTLKPAMPGDCLAKFRANRALGLLLLAGIAAAQIFAAP